MRYTPLRTPGGHLITTVSPQRAVEKLCICSPFAGTSQVTGKVTASAAWVRVECGGLDRPANALWRPRRARAADSSQRHRISRARSRPPFALPRTRADERARQHDAQGVHQRHLLCVGAMGERVWSEHTGW